MTLVEYCCVVLLREGLDSDEFKLSSDIQFNP